MQRIDGIEKEHDRRPLSAPARTIGGSSQCVARKYQRRQNLSAQAWRVKCRSSRGDSFNAHARAVLSSPRLSASKCLRDLSGTLSALYSHSLKDLNF